MKRFTAILICILLFTTVMIAQNQNPEIYQRKIESFSRMRSAGWVMTGIGGGFATAGIVMLKTVQFDNNDEDDDFGEFIDDTFQTVAGSVFMGVGIGLLAGGITMTSISSHKINVYKGKQANLSLGLSDNPINPGFSLVLKF